MTPPGHTAPWMLAALVLAGAGIWIAGSVARHAGQSFSPETGPPTGPVRREERVVPVVADALAAWQTRCDRGLEIREIRWIVSDYQAAFPEPDPAFPPPSATLEQRQKSWYLALLVPALSLSPEQVSAARAALAAPRPRQAPPAASPGPDWLRTSMLLPPELCSLSPSQLAILQPAAPAESTEPASPVLPGPLAHAALFFPLLPSQQEKIRSHPGTELLPVARNLHPAQLQTLLLADGIPAQLLDELARSE